jgi:hypothetical protein
MSGYAIGLLLLSAAVATWLVLQWNALEVTPSQAKTRKPVMRRRILAAAAIPVVLLAAAFLTLALAD